MNDKDDLIDKLTQELGYQGITRRQEIAMALIGRGYTPADVPVQAQLICDWIEGAEHIAGWKVAVKKASSKAGKRRGRRAPPLSAAKRKYTKRSKFWKK